MRCRLVTHERSERTVRENRLEQLKNREVFSEKSCIVEEEKETVEYSLLKEEYLEISVVFQYLQKHESI